MFLPVSFFQIEKCAYLLLLPSFLPFLSFCPFLFICRISLAPFRGVRLLFVATIKVVIAELTETLRISSPALARFPVAARPYFGATKVVDARYTKTQMTELYTIATLRAVTRFLVYTTEAVGVSHTET